MCERGGPLFTGVHVCHQSEVLLIYFKRPQIYVGVEKESSSEYVSGRPLHREATKNHASYAKLLGATFYTAAN